MPDNNETYNDDFSALNDLNDSDNSESVSDKLSDTAEDSWGKKTITVPKPKIEIGVDTDNIFLQQMSGESSQLDIATVESFTQVSQQRDTLMEMLDTMAQDPIISAVLETYAEDATETNQEGKIIWAESDDADTAKYVQYLLDVLNIDKHAYSWIKSLCLYGDLYLKLFRQSDIDDCLFDDKVKAEQERNKLNEALTANTTLDESVFINVASKNDRYVNYIEAVPNPSEMFDLIKFGRSYAYIKADVRQSTYRNNDANFIGMSTMKYRFNRQDVEIFQPTEFVHACLDELTSRTPEEVQIFMSDKLATPDLVEQAKVQESLTYTVKRGQSIFYNTFKIWRELMLLKNALLLNRLTKSSLVRIIGVEVGDQPKEEQRKQLVGIKQLFEQKSAINQDKSFSEYTNPGPMENNIFVPIHNGQGSVSITTAGGDVDVKNLADVDYFNNLLFGALKIPKQYLGFTDDDAGFSGGQSLSLISSRYAKTVKRLQNTFCQMITDVINLFLIDKGQQNRINKFTIRMQEPTTQEEIDRRDNLSSEVGVINDIMNLLSDIETPSTKLKITKTLIANIINDSDILKAIQDEIDRMDADNADQEDFTDDEGGFDEFSGSSSGGFDDFGGFDEFEDDAFSDMDNNNTNDTDLSSIESEDLGELPSPEDLGAGDFSDSSMDFD